MSNVLQKLDKLIAKDDKEIKWLERECKRLERGRPWHEIHYIDRNSISYFEREIAWRKERKRRAREWRHHLGRLNAAMEIDEMKAALDYQI